MSSIDPNLLRPSLSRTSRPPAAPYSTQMGFFCAFFGGPLGAGAWSALNTWRTRHWRRDALPLASMLLLGIGWMVYAHVLPNGNVLAFAQPWIGRPDGVLMDRVVGFAMFGVGVWLQRREQRSAVLFGLPVPNGWIPGIAVIVGSYGVLALAQWASR